LRRDAADNRDSVLAAAAIAVRREGVAVPMATIAADAGVGVGTVYRHFPSRDALLGALAHRSFEMVLEATRDAAAGNRTGIEAVRAFLDRTIDHGADLVLPMHGGPPIAAPATKKVQAEVHRILNSLLERGRQDATIRTDIEIGDVIVFGALLVQQLPHVQNWSRTARRLAAIYTAGLTPASESSE
jgi:AcrR family transcriptional regulator